ncbi:hypothetical protein D3C71_1308330 [compost metagenome]
MESRDLILILDRQYFEVILCDRRRECGFAREQTLFDVPNQAHQGFITFRVIGILVAGQVLRARLNGFL